MRILILSDRIPPENVGGAGVAAWRLARALQRAGHDVHVIAATAGAPFEDTREGIPTHHLHASYPERFQAWLSLWNPQTAGPLRRLFARLRPDVVHAHNVHRDLTYASLAIAHSMGVPTVLTSHDLMPVAYGKVDPRALDGPRLTPLYNLRRMRFRYNPLRNVAIRRVLRGCVDIRTCVSDAQRRLLEANGLPPFVTVHNALDPSEFAAAAASIEQVSSRLGLAGRRVVLFGGRIGVEKGTRQLLEAMVRVVEHVPDALLLVLTRARLERAGFDTPAYSRLAEGHVRPGGWLGGNELAAAFRATDVVVLPSIYVDAAPLVCLEAMAAARPAVVTCHGGASEYVADGETGFVADPFDADTFADRLSRLLLDADLRRRMGEAGHRRLTERFSPAHHVSQVTALYSRAGGGAGPMSPV